MKGVLFNDEITDIIGLLFADDAARFGGTIIRYQQQMDLEVRKYESFGKFLSKKNQENLSIIVKICVRLRIFLLVHWRDSYINSYNLRRILYFSLCLFSISRRKIVISSNVTILSYLLCGKKIMNYMYMQAMMHSSFCERILYKVLNPTCFGVNYIRY